jgi:hypothetical protein
LAQQYYAEGRYTTNSEQEVEDTPNFVSAKKLVAKPSVEIEFEEVAVEV